MAAIIGLGTELKINNAVISKDFIRVTTGEIDRSLSIEANLPDDYQLPLKFTFDVENGTPIGWQDRATAVINGKRRHTGRVVEIAQWDNDDHFTVIVLIDDEE